MSTIFVGSSRFKGKDEQQGAAYATPTTVSTEPAATPTRLVTISSRLQRRPVRHQLPRRQLAAMYLRFLWGCSDGNEINKANGLRGDANTGHRCSEHSGPGADDND